MISFLIIGEGEAARAVLSALLLRQQARIVVLLTASPDSSTLVSLARKHHIEVQTPRVLLSPGSAASLMSQQVDWLLSANNTVIVPASVLALCRRGALNLHPGPLPEYAGLHTHQWAIRNSEREFGATIHLMDPSVDSGAIVRQRRFALEGNETGLSLFKRSLKIGIELFEEIITQIVSDVPLSFTPQNLTKRRAYRHEDILDARIDWKWPASAIDAFVRAGNYEPFRSPTYVATLDSTSDFSIEVLRVAIEERTSKPPGFLLDVAENGLLVACGDGRTIRIVHARSQGRPLQTETWRRYVAQLPNGVLRGRSVEPRA